MNGLLSFLLLTFVLLYTSFFISCGSSGKKEIEEVLSKRESAFETKNLELYLSCISPTYREEKNGKTIGIEEIKKNFLSNVSIFDQIQISHFDRNIYERGQEAQVVQKTKVRVRIGKDESSFLISENLNLKKIQGRWKIVKESGADFLKGFVFGEGT
jgi:hypothetical protein